MARLFSAAGAPLRNVAAAWGGLGGATVGAAPRQNISATYRLARFTRAAKPPIIQAVVNVEKFMERTGLYVRTTKEPPPIKLYWLIAELKKKKIPQSAFAERLGITVAVLTGASGMFPVDRIAECMRLLDSWDGITLKPAIPPSNTKDHPWRIWRPRRSRF